MPPLHFLIFVFMNNEEISAMLIRKYDKPVPRYTSYPSIPFWKDSIDVNEWSGSFTTKFSEQNHINGISIYIHLPFCESLCTYCGCNKKITTNHKVEEEYLHVLEKEWLLYRRLMKQTPIIREIHLGGGTPTFFSPANLKDLMNIILKGCIIHPQHEFSIEGHPNNTTPAHLKVLARAGFRRISFGVQDNDPEVQRIINRVQPFENVKAATQNARAAGFTSVNFDLIYGLPRQTTESIEKTITTLLSLVPDRVAFYSYAHVPWTSKGQRLFDESDLPAAEEKLALYIKGKKLLMNSGYTDIGMDHFALPSDTLYKAREQKKLHRNFMGYTTQHSGLLLGLGVSAISDTGSSFAQNHKSLHEYYASVKSNVIPVNKGYFLTDTDVRFKKYIRDICCQGETIFKAEDIELLKRDVFPALSLFKKENLLDWNNAGLKLTMQGHYFIRNICGAFDLFLNKTKTGLPLFSKAI